MNRTKYTKQAQRWVVKIGSALLTKDGAGLDYEAIADWSAQIASLREQGREIILVSSGSVAEGMSRMGWKRRPKELAKLQAAAAIGQTGLIEAYESEFKQYNIQAAQILLTHDDVSNRRRYLNARNTLRTLIELKTLPIINENDTVALEEMRLGDNDTLAALVANLVEADLLVILTDQQGLFDKDPRHHEDATLICEDSACNQGLLGFAGKVSTALGSGGMTTKITAAQRAARSGCATVIASGREDKVLERLSHGETLGTLLIPDTTPLVARKQWIAGHVNASGVLHLDQGAAHSVQKKGASLLPIGVEDAEGDFRRGDVVDCKDHDGKVIARGLINYAREDVLKLCKNPSSRISEILGYQGELELIHRDNLVLLN